MSEAPSFLTDDELVRRAVLIGKKHLGRRISDSDLAELSALEAKMNIYLSWAAEQDRIFALKRRTDQKLAELARKLGLEPKRSRWQAQGGAWIVWGGCSSEDFNTVAEIRAVLLEEQGIKVRRCERCNSVDHDTDARFCPQHPPWQQPAPEA
jgi:hypothetical protein